MSESSPTPHPTSLDAVLERLGKMEEKLETQAIKFTEELDRKDEIIAGLQRRLYGSKSERLDPNQEELDFTDDLMGKPEALAEEDGPALIEEDEGDQATEKPKRTRRLKRDLFPRNLAVIVREVLIPKEVQLDPDAYREIGEEHHDEISCTRSELFWERTTRKKFVIKEDRAASPLVLPAPEPSVPGTMCSAAFMAKILADKYLDHLPHYRQAARIERRYGAQISRQTLNKWTHAAADFLSPVADAILTEILQCKVVQVDETPIEYLQPGTGSTGKGYLWPVLDPMSGAVHYSWKLGRGHEQLVEILGIGKPGAYSGTIQCDGFSAYETLAKRYPGIQLGGCLAHIRRKFFESREQAAEVVMPVLQSIQQLYRVEENLRQSGAPPGCRELVRRSVSRPVAEELHKKIMAELGSHLPQSNLGKALRYALGQWPGFARYLIDGRLEIDNNLVENAIRPTKLGAKNYLFFGSAEAGVNSATIYTLMANCKAHGIDPERYLEAVLAAMTTQTTTEQTAELTPEKIAERWKALEKPMGESETEQKAA